MKREFNQLNRTVQVVAALLFGALVGNLHWGALSAQDSEVPATFTIAHKDFGPVIRMFGYIDHRTQGRFEAIANSHPEVKTIWIKNCPGSADDEANVEFCRYIYNNGFNTYMEANDEAHSGGVDLFVSGVERYAHPNAVIGVHSWSDGSGLNAAHLPRTHSEHRRYIDLYRDMWMTQEQAESFYFFTIAAAPPESTHNMTPVERDQYAITTTSVWPKPVDRFNVTQFNSVLKNDGRRHHTIEWPSHEGASYRIAYSHNLREWDLVQDRIVGTGKTIRFEFTLPGQSEPDQAFFQVRQAP